MSTRRGFMTFTAGAVAARSVVPIGAAYAGPSTLPSGGKSRSDNPDAELLTLAAEIKCLRTEAEQLQDSIEHLPIGDPQSVAAWDMINGIVERGHEKTATLATMLSRTMEGLKAKAALAFEHLDTELNGGPPYGEALEWSVCRDLLAGSAS